MFITEDFNAGGDWHNVSAEAHQSGLNAFRIGRGVVQGYLWAGRHVDLEHGLYVTVPEPASLTLVGLAMTCLIALRCRRRASTT